MRVGLLSLVYTWNDCEKWTYANTDHLTQTHQLCMRKVICHVVRNLHLLSGLLSGSGKGFRARDALIIGDWYLTNKTLRQRGVTAKQLRNQLRDSKGIRLSETGLEGTIFATETCSSSTSSPTTQPVETGLHIMSSGNVLTGNLLWCVQFHLSVQRRPRTCVQVQERDSLTSTSVRFSRLFAAASWTGVLFRSMIGQLWMLLIVTFQEIAIWRRLLDHLYYPLCNVSVWEPCFTMTTHESSCSSGYGFPPTKQC